MVARERRILQVLFFCFGLSTLLLTPPLQVADETVHFFRAYSLVTGENASPEGSAPLPRALTEFAHVMVPDIPFHPERRYPVERLSQGWSIRVDADDVAPAWFRNAAIYPPVSYVGPAVVFAALEPFHPSPLLLMYLGRLANLLIGTVALGVTLRLAGFLTASLAVMAFFPMTVAQTASLSADAVTLSASLLLGGCLARFLESEQRLGGPRLAAFASLGLVVTLAKFGYWLLPWAIALVPAARWGSSRRKTTCLALFGVAQIVATAGWLASVGIEVSLPPGVDPDAQIAGLLAAPWRIATVAFWTLVHGAGWFVGLVGKLGHLDTRIPAWFVVASLLTLLATPLASQCAPRVSTWGCVWLLTLCAATIAIINGAIYATYTPVGSPRVIGMQGRYLLPLMPLVMVVWTTTVARPTDHLGSLTLRSTLRTYGLPAYAIASWLVTTSSLWLRYWGAA